MTLNLSRIDPAQLVSDIGMIGYGLASKNRNEFKTQRDCADRALVSDELRLRQCLINLVANALKFTQNGTVELKVTGTDDAVTFAVSDTGIGMTAEQISRLFIPFEQADRSIASRFGGTGLGLALTFQFTQLLGGMLNVESTPGEGTTFSLTLPWSASGTVAPQS